MRLTRILLLGLLALLVGKEGEVDREAVALRKRVLNHCWMPRVEAMPTVKVVFELVVISAGTGLLAARSEVCLGQLCLCRCRRYFLRGRRSERCF